MSDSPGVRTRKQAAAEAAKQNAGTPTKMNGHINGSANPRNSSSSHSPPENIFLFWPNLIGMSLSTSLLSKRIS